MDSSDPRRTVAAAVEAHGVGLRSGQPCVARLRPAEAGRGVVINGAPLSPARVIPGVERATAIQTPEGPVALVEHLLAALWLREISDVEIEIEGGEPPILDGSALGWLGRIQPAALAATQAPVALAAPVLIGDPDDGPMVAAWPAPRFSAEISVEFPGLGPMSVEIGPPGPETTRAVAAARTFGFSRDKAALSAAGVIGGVSLENTVIFNDRGRPLNPEGLRWPDEPVRHKALDLIGDLMCLGAPLQARVVARRAGHRLHHALVRAIAAL